MAENSNDLHNEMIAPVPQWLQWAREIQGMCQTGLNYSKSDYDAARYRRLMEIASEIVEIHAGLPAGPLAEHFSAQPGYATVKVDVRAAVVRDGKVLLVQEKKDRRWAMPGGWADVGEVPSQMVAREAFEESGLIVIPRKVIGVYDANRAPIHLEFYHAYKIVFLCEIIGGSEQPGDETIAADFFSFENLPALSTYRTSTQHIAELYEHIRDATRPAAFD